MRGEKEKHAKHIDIQSRALTISLLLLRSVSQSYHYAQDKTMASKQLKRAGRVNITLQTIIQIAYSM